MPDFRKKIADTSQLILSLTLGSSTVIKLSYDGNGAGLN